MSLSTRREFRRREAIRIGALATLGLGVDGLARLRAASEPVGAIRPRRANACVFVFLFGGPSHIDLWDMKPDAPAEIAGEFRPIDTTVPGIRLCEHLPKLSAMAHLFCLLRSMTHRMNVHGPACSELYTGRPYFGPPVTDQATPEDWPSVASMVMRFGPWGEGWPPSVVLPWYTQFDGQDRRIAGQTGGRMGPSFDPFLVEGDPARPDFRVSGLALPTDLPIERVQSRDALLKRLEGVAEPILPADQDTLIRHQFETAMAMLGNRSAARAFELAREPAPIRERYGSSRFSRSLLLARRLVEAGIPLITVNWHDATADEKVSPFWDTHDQNFPRLKDHLCPLFDRAFSAFIEDLQRLGLLETTLVIAVGEFGRTPKIGQLTQNAMTEKTGRDHWPHAFTALMAGGGVRGGQVLGSTDAHGAFVTDAPVTPADLAATTLMHLGIDPSIRYWDPVQQVERVLCEGTPIRELA